LPAGLGARGRRALRETTTHGELARSLGAGTQPQNVCAAVGRNRLRIIIPCHRVVGATGKLTGYADGLHRKRALLESSTRGR
jgi:methylated-DNA-[protein]-cysteine S-methyltransferase